MKQVVVASNNPGKLRELGAMLAAHGIEALPQSSFGVVEAEEPHELLARHAIEIAE